MKRILALLAGTMLLASACTQQDSGTGDGDKDETKQASDKIEITGKEYSFNLPSTIKGGFVDVSFKNEGKLVHEAGFIKVDSDTKQADFVNDFKKVVGEEGNPIPAYIKPYFASEEVKAGASASAKQSLPAGTYFLVCTLDDKAGLEEEGEEESEGPSEGGPEEPHLPAHFEQGMIKKVTVTGPQTVDFPDSEAVISATEYTFEATGLKPGKNEVLFRNDGPKEIHMSAIMEFPEGIDEAAAQKAVEAFGGDGPPPEGTPEPEEAAFGGIFEVGGGSLFELDAKANRVYAILCFIPDRAGGPPHVAKGMTKLVKVA